jgi:predicted PurR-regulated permease PerM
VHSQLALSRLRLLRLLSEHTPPVAPVMGASAPADLSAGLLTLLPAAGYSLFVTVGTLLFSYYWLLYRERSIRGLLLLLPMDRRAAAEMVWGRIEERIGAFLRGQALLALITGAFSLVAYWLIGLPYVLLIALVAAVLEFVPFLGPIIATLVAVVLGFSQSPQLGLSALVAGIVVQQIENNFLAPRIMDKAVGISPVVTLLAFVGFAALFGPAGGLMAIPLAAVLQVLFVAWLERNAAAAEAGAAGRSLTDRLRYTTRDLARDIAAHLRQKDALASADADTLEEELEQLLADLDGLISGRATRPADTPLAEVETAAIAAGGA